MGVMGVTEVRGVRGVRGEVFWEDCVGGRMSTGERSKRVDRFFARRLGIKTNDLGSVGCTKQLAGSLTSTHRVVSTTF